MEVARATDLPVGTCSLVSSTRLSEALGTVSLFFLVLASMAMLLRVLHSKGSVSHGYVYDYDYEVS